MLNAAEEEDEEEASADLLVEAEEEEASSKAEPYRMGRRLLIGSGGPTKSAPGRAVKRADRREGLAEDAEGADEEEAVDEDGVA